MGLEANIHLIRTLEKQIEEGNGNTIKLKRARNSLLNVSTRVPPEMLGEIFIWMLLRDTNRSLRPSHFDGLQNGCYNFLLVCHHWFEVACRTPELWNLWGNTLQGWKTRHHRSGASPIDLLLNGNKCDPGVLFDGPLQAAVRNHFIQDSIRQVHLQSNDSDLLTAIISLLTPDDDGTRNENIESIVWRTRGDQFVDASHFFAQSRLSKLRLLDLSGNIRISSWDGLASWTTLLTNLSLGAGGFPTPPTITASQLFQILASNPNLQELVLSDIALPNDAEGSDLQVPLLNLKLLSLTGDFRRVFGVLSRLILPEALDEIYLIGFDSTVEEISQTFAPYMRNYFRRDSRFQDRLGVSSRSAPGSTSIAINVLGPQAAESAQKIPFVTFTMVLDDLLTPEAQEQLLIDLIALIPREHVVFLDAKLNMKPPEGLFFGMSNIETLCLSDVELSEGFLQPNPDGPHANTKLFPSLRWLYLESVEIDDDDWGHLTAYLAHQTSGNQLISLEVLGAPHISPMVMDEIKGLVGKFTYYQKPEVDGEGSPWGCGCSTPEEDEW